MTELPLPVSLPHIVYQKREILQPVDENSIHWKHHPYGELIWYVEGDETSYEEVKLKFTLIMFANLYISFP